MPGTIVGSFRLWMFLSLLLTAFWCFASPADASLLGYWGFDSASTGNTTPGLSGVCPAAVLDAKLTGSAALQSVFKKWGNSSVSFSENGYVDTGDWKFPNGGTTQMSASAWIYPNKAGGDPVVRYVIVKQNTFAMWRINRNLVCAMQWDEETTLTASFTNVLLQGNWFHVACIYSGTQLCAAVNGATKADSCVTAPNLVLSDKRTAVIIGASSRNFTIKFDGYIDEVKVYDHALTQSELQSLYTMVQPNDVPTATIVLDPSSDASAIFSSDDGYIQAEALTYLAVTTDSTDNGSPYSGSVPNNSPLQFSWSVLSSGCGTVDVSDPSAAVAAIDLEGIGQVTVQVCVSDGELASSSQIQMDIVASPPVVTEEPGSEVDVVEGQSEKLTVVCSAVPTPQFQWQELGDVNNTANGTQSFGRRKRDIDFVDIPNETSRVLTINGTSDQDGRTVRCVIRNSAGVVVTNASVIRVVPDDSLGDGDGLSGGGVAGLVIGLLALVCLLGLLAIALVAALLYWRRRERGFARKLRQPDYELIAFGEVEEPRGKYKDYGALEQALLEDDFALSVSILQAADSAAVDGIAKSLMYIAQANGLGAELLSTQITEEVEHSGDEGTLFRSNSPAPKLFGVFVRIIGLKYLWHMLVLPINTLNDNALAHGDPDDGQPSSSSGSGSKSRRRSRRGARASQRYKVEQESEDDEEAGGLDLIGMSTMELDPKKRTDEADVMINSLELWLVAQKMFKSIMNSERSMPLEIRQVIGHLNAEVGKKFSEDAQFSAIGGFYFLRFICPAILAPHSFGLLEEPPHQRQLILISKVLQNLANNTMPGEKEEYMQQLNNFILSNKATLERFYGEVVRDIARGRSNALTISEPVKMRALAQVHEHITSSSNLKKIDAELKKREGGKAMSEQLHGLLEELEDS